MTSKQKILLIVGPTASGKSALAVEIAKKFDGEIISADSRQVYRGLDISTGKITSREMKGVPHHLLDVASPRTKFNADDFVTHATRAIGQIVCRGKLPIIVGGTGFYIDALVGWITLPDVPPNPTLRKMLALKTTAQLFALLKKKDSTRAKMMNTPSERNNRVRLIRALEIASSRRNSQIRKATPYGTNLKVRLLSQPHVGLGDFPKSDMGGGYDTFWIGINPPLKMLEKKIAVRLSERLKHGMIAEARRLHGAGLSYKRMIELGLEYRSLARFLRGQISRTELEAELNRDIRRYAKHQLAYWRRNTDIRWIKPTQKNTISKSIHRWLDAHYV